MAICTKARMKYLLKGQRGNLCWEMDETHFRILACDLWVIKTLMTNCKVSSTVLQPERAEVVPVELPVVTGNSWLCSHSLASGESQLGAPDALDYPSLQSLLSYDILPTK